MPSTSERLRHIARVATTPRLWREQIEYWRHGPAWSGFPVSPWETNARRAPATCNVCGWTGAAFGGIKHSESQLCPICGSIARDRYLFWCMQQRVKPAKGLRVLETSPRMGADYRNAMAGWFDYTASDFDESAHIASVRIDLQDIALPDASIDVVMTPHVLEHVPKTELALRELHRVIAPGGHLLLQLPILQGSTAPPTEPEFHADNTPVFWRFGFDLVDQLRASGFDTRVLCIDSWRADVAANRVPPGPHSPEFDVPSMIAGSRIADLDVVATNEQAERLGLYGAYQFVLFHGVRR
ncbi:MAG: class I SAM-dependent methyltransferase [Acidimicrobiia bacterium]